MKGDFSRDSFDPGNHYTRVLMQQGRVQLDADWNEQQAIHRHHAETAARDLVGGCGAPAGNAGFALAAVPGGSDLAIGAGRIYVNGVLCELEIPAFVAVEAVVDRQTVRVATPVADGRAFGAGQWVEISAAGLSPKTVVIVAADAAQRTLALGDTVAEFLEADVVLLRRVTTYLTQPDFPAPDHGVASQTPGAARLQLADGQYVAYLDVWERHVTALERPAIREVALGGADTCTRARTVWQVKLLKLAGRGASCGDSISEWELLVAAAGGRLSARAQPEADAADPCLLPPGAGYRSLENQLYRVEVHGGGALGAATFRWSRDNATVVTAIEAAGGQTVTVHDLGRDDSLGFAGGQWVEIVDEVQELAGRPGTLVQIDAINAATRTITFRSAPPAIDLARNPRLRRWDGSGELALTIPAENDGWIALENGVEVRFEPGSYRTGDYWLIPARSVTGELDWPHLDPQPPRGIVHHYGRLGLVQATGGQLALQDCRKLFAPLAEVPPALHVNGINWANDDAMPQEQLAGNGLQVFLDGAPDPQLAESLGSVMSVTLEVPVQVSAEPPVLVPQNLILDGEVGFASPATLQWKPAATGQLSNLIANVLVKQQIASARMRVVIKGAALWSDAGGSRAYLDGQALGRPGLGSRRSRVDLALPSGDGRRASDFESWFFLQVELPKPKIASLVLGQTAVIGGTAVAGTVTLDNPALAGGATVALASSIPAIAKVPASLVVPPGQLQASFVVNTVAGGSGISAIQATLEGVTQQANLQVQLVSVTVSPARVSLFTQGSQQFTAAVTGTSKTGVSWKVVEAGGGSINSTGLYVAPAAAGTFTVVATSLADPSKSASATVDVTLKRKDKEKEKEKDKEIKEFDKVRETKIIKEIDLAGNVRNTAPLAPVASGTDRSFITAEERPIATGGTTPIR